MNMLAQKETLEVISALLQAISPTPRLEILLAIGNEETCVCHLEAMLGYRQAYISQHLMALREAALIEGRREGRYIYYRLKKPAILEVLQSLTSVANLAPLTLPPASETCCCPKCSTN